MAGEFDTREGDGWAAERAQALAEAAVHEERRRLALQMHDTVGAMLFGIGASVRKLLLADGIPPELRDGLVSIARQANQAVDSMRRSLLALYTPPEEALDEAVVSHCRAFEGRTGVCARLIHLTDVPTLAPASSLALSGAVREALLNVEKHARARSVVVTLACRKGRVTVTVVDDGVGLGASVGGDRFGMGLAAASERLADVGGGFRVEDNDEGGVTVRAWVPE